ncbi:MAG: hypothetical protein HQL99_12540 [Magnetococcales bacterium]|nr:hypothetical protein [Magnetococcales bacterium]
MKIRMMAALSYMGILCLVPVLLNKTDRFIDFHARQGLVLWIWSVLSFFAMHIPGLGPYLFSTSTVLVLFLSAFGLVSVALNTCWKIPLIATVAPYVCAEPVGESPSAR